VPLECYDLYHKFEVNTGCLLQNVKIVGGFTDEFKSQAEDTKRGVQE
jgi:hypothetical protein